MGEYYKVENPSTGTESLQLKVTGGVDNPGDVTFVRHLALYIGV